MKLKNVKIGDLTVKDILEEIYDAGKLPTDYEGAFKAMNRIINKYLGELE